MKSSEIFIANILDEIEQADSEALSRLTGLGVDEIRELDDENPIDVVNIFLLALHGLGYKISSPDGEYINFVEDI